MRYGFSEPSIEGIETILVGSVFSFSKVKNFGFNVRICLSSVQATIARGNDVGPHKITDTMAFMFESSLIPRISRSALESPFLDHDYYQCWIGLKSHFASS